ncbi:MAG: hypothetical protein HY827_09370 [Actinobacteria bacterium]|nr:hypothetical protein [Actinomycetota bacterium]
MKWIGYLWLACALVMVGCGDGADPNSGSTGGGGASVATGPSGASAEDSGETAATSGTGADGDCVESDQKPDINLKLIVGHPFPEAKRNAENEDFLLRMIARDGESLPVTLDYRKNRINVAVRDGEVSKYCHMG